MGVDFRFDGVRYRKRSPENSRSGALAYENVIRQKLARGEALDPVKEKKILFRDFAEQWVKDYVEVNCYGRLNQKPVTGSLNRPRVGPFLTGRNTPYYSNGKNRP